MNGGWRTSSVLVRLFHTTLTVAVVTSLFLTNTSLRKALVMRENVVYALLFLATVLAANIMYWTACLSDPGFVPLNPGRRFSESEEDDDGEVTLESSKMLKNGIKLRKCGFCGVVQPLRSRHCDDCDRCVRKFDHHCPYLGTCVGENNHKFFWLFLLAQSVVIVWGAGVVWHSFVFVGDHWLQTNLVFLLDIAVFFMSGFVVICLLCLHTHIMCMGTTTWEMMSRDRITYLKHLGEMNPFHEGYCKNMGMFLCKCVARQWDRIYNRAVPVDPKAYSEEALKLNREADNDHALSAV